MTGQSTRRAVLHHHNELESIHIVCWFATKQTAWTVVVEAHPAKQWVHQECTLGEGQTEQVSRQLLQAEAIKASAGIHRIKRTHLPWFKREAN